MHFASWPLWFVGVFKLRIVSMNFAFSSFDSTYGAVWSTTYPGFLPGCGCKCGRILASFKSSMAFKVSRTPQIVFITFSQMFFSQCMRSKTCLMRRSFQISQQCIPASDFFTFDKNNLSSFQEDICPYSLSSLHAVMDLNHMTIHNQPSYQACY